MKSGEARYSFATLAASCDLLGSWTSRQAVHQDRGPLALHGERRQVNPFVHGVIVAAPGTESVDRDLDEAR